MRYKINKPTLLRHMAEYGQTTKQRIAYLQYTMSVIMKKDDYLAFNALALGFNIYYLLLNEVFELLRVRYSDYLVIVQKDIHFISIEIRKLTK